MERGTPIRKSSSTTNATVIVHTVTASKVLILETVSIACSVSGAGTCMLFIRNVADAVQYSIFSLGFAGAGHVACSIDLKSLHIPEGWDICLLTTTGVTNIYAFLKGYEVTV